MQSRQVTFVILAFAILTTAGIFFLFSGGIIFGGERITDEECLMLARKIENSVSQENPEVLNNALSHYAFLSKVAENIGFRNKSYLARLSIKIKENIRFGDMIMGYLKRRDGYFHFTKLYYDRKVPHLIFRIYTQTQGLNYFDCEIQRMEGELKISDVYIYYSGELWSTTYTRHMKMMEDYNLGIVENIHPENPFYNSLLKIDTINQMLNSGAVEAADSIFYTIPQTFRDDRIFKAAALRIASYQNSEVYSRAIQRYLATTNNGTAVQTYFNFLYAFSGKEIKNTRKSAQALNEITGEDNLMNLFIAQSYQNEKKFKKAISLYDQLIEEYPDLFEIYWYKVSTLIESGEFDKAVDFLTLISHNFDARIVDLEDMLLEFPDFLNSRIYQNWRGVPTI